MLEFLTMTGRDQALRAEARRRGEAYIGYRRDGALHRDAVDENLAGKALGVAGQEADAPFFDAVLAMLVKTQDDVVRGRLLGTLSAALDPKLAARARDLVLDPRIKYTEMLTPLWVQLGAPETRDAAWAWLKEHWDAVAARASTVLFEGVQLVSMPGSFCDDVHESDVATFLKERATKIEGGPRVLSKTVESIHLCTVKRRAEEDNARTFFTKR
jgi:alanyl aminopeptidase